MKRYLLLLFFSTAILEGYAYDFSAVCSTGQTLYYNFTSDSTVSVTYPQTSSGNDYYLGHPKPAGYLIIPDSVIYGGTTYRVTGIGANAFYYCSGIDTLLIGNEVTSIGFQAFYHCSGIDSLLIGNKVTSIGFEAFYGCWGIHRLVIPNSVTFISAYAFKGCDIDSLYIGSGVTTIGNEAFFGCSMLKYMHYNARNLDMTNLVNSDYLGSPFHNTPTNYFRTLVIGDSVRTIPSGCFFGRSSIDSIIVIPDSVTSIGGWAFSGCSGIDSLYIGSGVTTIPQSAFSGCSSIHRLVIPNSVTSIGQSSFYGCSSIDTLVIGSGVTTISQSAFSGCSGIHHLVIPNSVSSIGQSAFFGCTGIDSLYIGSGVTTIGNEAFEGCTGLKYMHYNARNLNMTGFMRSNNSSSPFYNTATNDFRTLVIGDSVRSIPTGTFSGRSSIDSTVVIPDSVSSIGPSAFYGCSGIDSLYIGGGVTSVGDFAFEGCSSIHRLVIPNSVTNIGEYAFYGCRGIDSLHIGYSVTTIGSYAFFNCDNILSINTNARTIGNSAFANCDRLVYVTLGDSVQTIGSGAFSGCFRLNNVSLGEGINSIGDNAFSGCIRLTKPELPNSLTTIGTRAFDGCGDINGKLTFPVSITHIGDSAYNGVGTITEIEMKGSTPPTIHAHTFAAVDSLVTVSVPCGAVLNYYITDYWENFPNIVEAPPYRLTVQSNNEVMGTATVTQQTTCSNHTALIQATANSGYHFLQWNDGITANPRTVPMTQDSAFTAIFVVNNSYITGHANDSTMGSVSGTGLYGYNAPVTLTATPYSGYHFLRWSDGNTQNPRYLAAVRDSSFTAIFVSNVSTITVANANPDMGNVSGSGVYYYQNLVSLTATANYGYHFVQWNDGNTQNPRTIMVSQDSSFTAYFALNTYSIVATSNSTTMGSVSGGGQYTYLHEMSMTATPAYGYHFVQWNDGVTDNPRTLTVTRDSAFTAQFAANSYTLTVAPNDPAMGSAYGAGSYNYNTTATLTAVANYGYHFTQWSDAVTDNPRTVTVLNNATYTAQFAINSYTLTVQSSNPAIGTTSGSGSYNYLTPVNITALPNAGYHFTQWSDGNMTNPRLISVTANATYTAQFAINSYAVGVTSNNSTMGSVSGSGTYNHNSTAILTATPYYGYHFVQWQDGNTQNPRTVVVTDSAQYTAQFAYNSYLITTLSNNISRGSTMGSGSYNFLSQTEITAVPMPHYHFTQWSDGVIDNPRTITVTQDSTFTAYFDINQFSLILDVNDTSLGYVSGSGIYNDMSQVTISATAAQHCHFVQWSDGNTTNPRLLTLTCDTAFTALFERDQQYQITVVANDSTRGSVAGGGLYYLGESVAIAATANEHYYFDQWSDGVTTNPRVVTVTGDATYTAVFEPVMYTLTVAANDYAMGQVTGSGSYAYGTTVTTEARAFGGYRFAGWDDGIDEAQRMVTVTADATYTALFEPNVGIDEATAEGYKVYVRQHRIVVEGVEERRVQIYDLTGRRHSMGSPLAAGVYLVCIDNTVRTKVVVIQ